MLPRRLVFAVLASLSCGRSRIRSVIRSAGSDTVVNLAQAWAEAYAEVEPSVSVEVSGGGSGTGLAALIDGAADLANSSRRIEPEEREAARRKREVEPIEWIIGHDALAVYVHRDNPLNEITIPQLAAIYGTGGQITRWSQLGPGLPDEEIILISRQSNSGTAQYFRRALLGSKGDFRQGTRDLNGSKEVVSLVGETLATIGYSGMGYDSDRVKMLAVSTGPGQPAYAPTLANALSGRYPISRPLYVYTLGRPGGELQRYLDWTLSPAGQRVVVRAGFVPKSPIG
jgi:phosphate transport system substrate-binding protein